MGRPHSVGPSLGGPAALAGAEENENEIPYGRKWSSTFFRGMKREEGPVYPVKGRKKGGSRTDVGFKASLLVGTTE